jgi:hypothetical protein
VKHLVRVLGELAHVDEAFEQQAKLAAKRALVFGIAAFLSIFAAFFLGMQLGGYAALLPIGIAALAVRSGLRYRHLKKRDMIDDFRLCLRPLLRDIAHDLDPSKRIKVEMDLTGPADSKQKSKLELPPGRFQKLTETVFLDPWCQVKLPLADGSTAILEFENCYRKYDRRYRTARGKIKWKTKWRKECTASATILPPAGVVWNEQRLGARLDGKREKVKLVDKEGVTGARLEGYWMFKGASDLPGQAPPGQAVVGMLLRVHSAMRSAASGEVAR